jgi:hypothetical protein
MPRFDFIKAIPPLAKRCFASTKHAANRITDFLFYESSIDPKSHAPHHETLEAFFGDDYEAAYKIQQRIVFLLNWKTYLIEQCRELSLKSSKSLKDEIFLNLAVKKIFDKKKKYYKTNFSDSDETQQTIIGFLLSHITPHSEKNETIKSLQEQEKQLATAIKDSESYLKADDFAATISTAIRLITLNPAYQLGKAVGKKSFEKFKDENKTDTFNPKEREHLVTIQGLLFYGTDAYLHKISDAKSFFINKLISPLLFANIDLLVATAKKIGIDEQELLPHLSKLEWAAQLGTYILSDFIRLGFGLGTLGYSVPLYRACPIWVKFWGRAA